MGSPQAGLAELSFWNKNDLSELPGTTRAQPSHVAAEAPTNSVLRSAFVKSRFAAGCAPPWQPALPHEGTKIEAWIEPRSAVHSTAEPELLGLCPQPPTDVTANALVNASQSELRRRRARELARR